MGCAWLVAGWWLLSWSLVDWALVVGGCHLWSCVGSVTVVVVVVVVVVAVVVVTVVVGIVVMNVVAALCYGTSWCGVVWLCYIAERLLMTGQNVLKTANALFSKSIHLGDPPLGALYTLSLLSPSGRLS